MDNERITDEEFELELQKIYQTLSSKQQPLGREFSELWDDISDLYES